MSSQQQQSGARKSGGTLGGMLSSFTARAQSQLQNLSVSEIPHTLRQATATYDPRQSAYTLRLQLMNKALKGVMVDAEALGRERQAFSKQVYLWSQDQHAPAKDLSSITDCLAFLTFKSGDVELDYAKALESARSDIKDIRNFENDLSKDRDRRKTLEASLVKLQASDTKHRSDHHEHVASIQNEMAQLDKDSKVFEASLDVLKRKKIRSSFATQFAAMRELGEKLSIIAGYGDLLLEELDQDGTPPKEPYEDKARTAWIRGATANALSSYRAPLIALPTRGQGESHVDFEKHDTRSFGETHKNELANMPSPSYDAHSPAPPILPPVPSTSITGTSPPPPPPPHPQSRSADHLSTSPLLPNPSLNHSPADPTGFSPTPAPHTLGAQHLASSGIESEQATTIGTGAPPVTGVIDIPPPPAGAEPTVAEIGGSVPTGTGGPSTGYFPIRRPLSKPEEVRLESQQHQQQQQQQQGARTTGTGTTSQQQHGGDGGDANEEALPAYSIQDSAAAPSKDSSSVPPSKV